MSKNWAKGEFTPKSPEKYIGKLPIIYRSSWEMTFMRVLDSHPNILKWSSESINIPYKNPLTGKWSYYVPDFLVVYVDKDNNYKCEVMEIKPAKEDFRYDKKVSKKTQLVQAINQVKWAAAAAYCVKKGWGFRVLTEDQLFGLPGKKR